MKLSTRSRYGARMMVELALNYDKGPLQLGTIAERQDISVKYLEQLITPLKKANLVSSFRGPKGGHVLSRPPGEITMGDIVRVLEGETDLVPCVSNPASCERVDNCLTREVWVSATRAMLDALDSVTLGDMRHQRPENGA